MPWSWIAALVAARFGLYLLSSGPLAYGYMGDEFYFLACARRLAWGYVDQPPLGIWMLAAVEPILGSSLLALHLLPTLAHAAAIVLCALLARELGGGRSAQGLAALAVLVASVYLGAASNYSLYIFDVALWAGAALVLARRAGRPGRLPVVSPRRGAARGLRLPRAPGADRGVVAGGEAVYLVS